MLSDVGITAWLEALMYSMTFLFSSKERREDVERLLSIEEKRSNGRRG